MAKKEILGNLMPEHSKVVVGKKSYEIGGLSIRQAVQLFKEVAKVTIRLGTADLSKLQKGESNLEDLLTLFDFLSEDEVTRIIGILLDEEDELFLKKNLSLQTITEILASVCERNDFGKILKNVQRMVGAVRKTISSPSLSG